MVTFYHYTTPESAEAIIREGVIRKSTKSARRRRDDARYGSGVYLTKLPPSMAKGWIAVNNYDGISSSVQRMIASRKVDAYISLELDPSDVVECYDEDGKNIFLYPNNDLVIRPYMNAQLGTTA